MKLIRTIRNVIILAWAVLYAVSCTAFTAPRDPITGIRQDAPEEWADTPNPLDTPGIYGYSPASEGVFGHEWMWR